jgi:hypothetical protein
MGMARYKAWTGTALGAAATALAVPTGVAVSGGEITAAGTGPYRPATADRGWPS